MTDNQHQRRPAALPNPKHQKFCELLARGGWGQGEAYTACYGSVNDSQASRLKNRYAEHIQALRPKREALLSKVVGDPKSLADLGIDGTWIAAQYGEIYAKAMEAGQLASANTAIANIQKLLDIEERNTAESIVEKVPEKRIDINALWGLLDRVSNLKTSSKNPDMPSQTTLIMSKVVTHEKDSIDRTVGKRVWSRV